METEKFITVLTFTFAHEVAIVRGRLESEGVTCFVQDELTAQIHPFYSNAIGGVKLQVRESDLNQALDILKETGYIQEQDSQAPNEPPRVNKQTDNPKIATKGAPLLCPFCGSDEVVKSKKTGWLFLLTSIPFWFPAPVFQKTYYCFDCKREFKPGLAKR